MIYNKLGLDREILKYFNLEYKTAPNLSKWTKIKDAIENPKDEINIAIIGKYNDYQDSYKSLVEAINHGAFSLKLKANIIWVNARENVKTLPKNIHAILVPGGFGEDGTAGKIAMIKFARENKIPFLGICFGMQMAVIEFARNVLKIKDATSSEIDSKGTYVVAMMHQWQDKNGKAKKIYNADLGGTMRLGAYECILKNSSLVHKIYNQNKITERHRHRYEVNINFKDQFEKAGMIFSGISSDGKLPEIIEVKDHPFFVGVQFHPELKSKPFQAHPLFKKFVEQALKYDKKN